MTDPTDATPPAPAAPPPAATPAAAFTPAPAPARVRKGWDIALTIVFLVLDLGFVVTASLIELFSFAFYDVCPNNDCNSVTDAASGIFTAAVVMVAIFVVALIVSIVLLILKRRAFWVPLAAGVLIVIVDIVAIAMAASLVVPTS